MTTISDLYHASVRDSRRQSYPSWDREAFVENDILLALRTLAPETSRHAFLRRLIMKLVREWHSPKLDNLVDIVGYTECQFSRFRSLYEPPAAAEPPTPTPFARCTDDPNAPTFPDTDQGRFDEMRYIINRTSLRGFRIGKYNQQGMFFHLDDVTVRERDGEWCFDIGSRSFDFQDFFSHCRFLNLTIDIDDLRSRKQTAATTPSTP